MQKLSGWVESKTWLCLVYKSTHLNIETQAINKKICHANTDHKKAGVAILIPEKVGPLTKNINKDKGHFEMIKKIVLPKIHTNLKCICNIKLKMHEAKADIYESINKNTWKWKILKLLVIDKSSRKRFSMNIGQLNAIINQLDLIDT
jgi:hypothetical protein